jgi:hypothetical protein
VELMGVTFTVTLPDSGTKAVPSKIPSFDIATKEFGEADTLKVELPMGKPDAWFTVLLFPSVK